MRKAKLATAGLVVLGVAAGLGTAGAADKSTAVPFSTPPGITLVDVTKGSEEFLWRRLGGPDGKPLYTYNADGRNGKATCLGECAKEFAPFVAARNAVAFGDWSFVTGEGNVRQWAYQGQPLYSYTGQDPAPVEGSRGAAGTGGDAAAMMDPGSKLYSPKEGWKRAALTLPKIAMPADVSLKSLATANGYGFVMPKTGMVMYVLKTAPKNVKAWTPVYAPGLAKEIGDFSILAREDGKRQWAYKGQALYTFNADYSPGDINGLVDQKDAQVAMAYRHYMPADLKIDILAFRGPIMVNAKGMTVYTQTAYEVQYGGRETRDGYRINYNDAKHVGTRGCVDACTKIWQPVVAPTNAQSSGFWEVATRNDGTKQWAYKGAPLYTYFEDKAPGDDNGNNRHDIVYGDAEGKVDLSLTGGDKKGHSGSGFYWHIVTFYN